MLLKHALAVLGATILFGVGVAAAFADSLPTTTDTTTTTAEPTTTTSTTTTTTTTSTTTTTPEPPTTTVPATTATLPTTPKSTSPPPRHETAPVQSSGPRVTADVPRGKARSPRHRKKHRRASKPLKVTPPLGQGGYVFPVAGDAGYIDTYGDFRSDVHGKWHHGDDVFAAFGTPVVAVANGTINRVGWRKAGGWRLWVRDSLANEFYYAHLSGYARTVFHSRYVKAGQVIGFVGNTGDAYPRDAHLHFEIHPARFLGLGYDGAVDPTSYLDSWTHLGSVEAPLPMHPRLPKQQLFRQEARQVFRRLLLARRLVEPATAIATTRVVDPEPSPLPPPLHLFAAPAAATAAQTGRESPSWQSLTAIVLGVVSLVLLTTAGLRTRRARRA